MLGTHTCILCDGGLEMVTPFGVEWLEGEYVCASCDAVVYVHEDGTQEIPHLNGATRSNPRLERESNV